MIQLSARHKSDDHLWFSFFHEAAHVLLHSKKSVFVDELNGDGADREEEVSLDDEWEAIATALLDAETRTVPNAVSGNDL